MFTWIIIFVIVGSIIGFIAKGREGAAAGAGMGLASIMTILTSIVLPLTIMVLLFKACFD